MIGKYSYTVMAFFVSFILITPSVEAAALTEKEVTAHIIKEINTYRASFGLKPVQTSDETCRFAEIRAQEISTNFSHDGFRQRRDSKTIPYQHWSIINENIAMTSNYKEVVNMWAHSPGHAKNMRDDTPYVCVVQYGKYFAYLGMRP